MALTNDDVGKVKKVVKDEVGKQLDIKLGPKLGKVEKLITKSLDQRLGPKLENIEILVEDVLERKLDEKLDQKLSHLPTKKEFFAKMDKLMTEVKGSRDEQTMLSSRIKVHTDQIDRIETHLGLPALDI